MQWEGVGPDGGPWSDTWVRVVHPWLSADMRRRARELERATYGGGRTGKRERPGYTLHSNLDLSTSTRHQIINQSTQLLVVFIYGIALALALPAGRL